jgi:hypothetical protein
MILASHSDYCRSVVGASGSDEGEKRPEDENIRSIIVDIVGALRPLVPGLRLGEHLEANCQVLETE